MLCALAASVAQAQTPTAPAAPATPADVPPPPPMVVGSATPGPAAGVTGLNCAGFGSAMVVTATFGMVAASQVLRKLADSVQPAVAPAETI